MAAKPTGFGAIANNLISGIRSAAGGASSIGTFNPSIGSDVAGTGTNVAQDAALYGIPMIKAMSPVKLHNGGSPIHIVDAYNSVAVMNTNDLTALQHELISAGILKQTRGNPIIFGSDLNQRTMKAWEQVVDQAARSGSTIDQVLNEYKTNKLKAAPNEQGFTSKVTSSTELAGTAQTVAGNLNIAMSQQDIAQATAAYQGAQQDYSAAINTGQSQAQDPGAAETFMEQWMRQNKPQEVQVGSTGSSLDLLNQAIKSNT